MASKERFHGGHFRKRIVLQAVFWYLRYSLSYRDIEEPMRERGVEIDHATVQRWVVKYTQVLEVEFRKRKKTVGTSWRMDETYIKVRGKWRYLYRAVDKVRLGSGLDKRARSILLGVARSCHIGKILKGTIDFDYSLTSLGDEE